MKVDDSLKIIATSPFSDSDQKSLSLLYEPLLDAQTLGFYRLLYALTGHHREVKNHLLLSKLCGVSMSRMEAMRKALEHYLLVRTSYHSKTNSYLIELLPPLTPAAFLAHPVLGRLYLKKMGDEAFEFVKLLLVGAPFSKEGYFDMSEPMENLLKAWNDEDEVAFEHMKPRSVGYDHINEAIQFDYQSFLQDLSQMVLPFHERSESNLKQIGLLATLYGIGVTDMKRMVARSIDLPDGKLNLIKLKGYVLEHFGKLPIEKVEEPYKLSPVKFLQAQQNGIPVNASDKKIIDLLLQQYKLQPEVVNALLEYSLQQTNQKLTRSFVEKVASTWVRLNIDTYEGAQKVIQDTKNQTPLKKATGKKAALPDWYTKEQPEEEVVEEVNIEALQKLWSNKEEH